MGATSLLQKTLVILSAVGSEYESSARGRRCSTGVHFVFFGARGVGVLLLVSRCTVLAFSSVRSFVGGGFLKKYWSSVALPGGGAFSFFFWRRGIAFFSEKVSGVKEMDEKGKRGNCSSCVHASLIVLPTRFDWSVLYLVFHNVKSRAFPFKRILGITFRKGRAFRMAIWLEHAGILSETVLAGTHTASR